MTTVTGSRPALDASTRALEPLAAALLRRAGEQASQLVGAAEQEGVAAIGDTRRAVDATVQAAAEQGRAEGSERVASDLAAARRRGRARLLQAQSAAQEEVRRAARKAVRELLDAPGNRDRLAAVLRDALGDAAQVRPTPDGGLQAVSGDGRALDASVAALAGRAVDELDLEALWTTS
jgi:hypothetical protein